MAKIINVKRVEIGRTAFGTNYTKGDYVATETHFMAKLATGALVELTKAIIWTLSGRKGAKRVSQKDLDLCRGKDLKI